MVLPDLNFSPPEEEGIIPEEEGNMPEEEGNISGQITLTSTSVSIYVLYLQFSDCKQ
jgi:hypothetical protein